MDPIEIAKNVEIKGDSGNTVITFPNWIIVLLIATIIFLVTGGVATNAFNVYLANQQIIQLTKRVDSLGEHLEIHKLEPAHQGTSKILVELLTKFGIMEERLNRKER